MSFFEERSNFEMYNLTAPLPYFQELLKFNLNQKPRTVVTWGGHLLYDLHLQRKAARDMFVDLLISLKCIVGLVQ